MSTTSPSGKRLPEPYHLNSSSLNGWNQDYHAYFHIIEINVTLRLTFLNFIYFEAWISVPWLNLTLYLPASKGERGHSTLLHTEPIGLWCTSSSFEGWKSSRNPHVRSRPKGGLIFSNSDFGWDYYCFTLVHNLLGWWCKRLAGRRSQQQQQEMSHWEMRETKMCFLSWYTCLFIWPHNTCVSICINLKYTQCNALTTFNWACTSILSWM